MNVEIIENGSFDVLARYGVPPESMPNRGATRMLSVRVPESLAKALRIYCIHHDTSLTSTIMSAIYTHMVERMCDSMGIDDAQQPHEEE